MDRLSTIVVLAMAAGAAGCESDGKREATPRERSNAVKISAKSRPDPVAMCDRHYAPGAGPRFSWPKLTSPAPSAPANTWRWINVWATWCKPCVEELPRLMRWRTRLSGAGVAVDLALVSADQNDDAVARFHKTHPRTPQGVRLAEPDAVATWIETLGVKGATLPVHVFVDPRGNVRCVRASAVQASDYPAIAALLRQ